MRRLPLAAAALVLSAAAAHAGTAPGLQGAFWDHDASLITIADAEAVIAAGPADATFIASTIDYPSAGGSISDATGLAAFLGVDGVGLPDTDLTKSVFEFTGWLTYAAGVHSVSVGSDDGFALWIDGDLVAAYDNIRSFSYTDASWTSTGADAAVRLIYWENHVDTGVDFQIDGVSVSAANAYRDVSAVPLPAAAPLMIAGLAAFAALRRRKG